MTSKKILAIGLKFLITTCLILVCCFFIYGTKPKITLRMNTNEFLNTREIWFDFPGPLLDRLHLFNQELIHIDNNILNGFINKSWTNISDGTDRVSVDSLSTSFLYNMSLVPQVHSVYLRWYPTRGPHKLGNVSSAFPSNILINKFYPWAADPIVCSKVFENREPDLKHSWPYSPYCKHQKELLLNETEIYPFTWLGQLTGRNIGGRSFTTYIHVIHDALVVNTGEIYADNYQLFPWACEWKGKNFRKWVNPSQTNVPLYDKVFSIAQIFGFAVYHRNIEQISRLAAYLEFLHNNQEVYVFVGDDRSSSTVTQLEWLGIAESRLLRHPVRAKILYSPQGIHFATPDFMSVQLLSYLYTKHHQSKLPHIRQTVLLIVRSAAARRRLLQAKELEDLVRNLTVIHGLTFELFTDDPPPPVSLTAFMFHRAVMVIAPHGAGLSNMIFSQKATFFIEILPRDVTLLTRCYQRLAYALGHRYYGILGEGGQSFSPLSVNLQHVRDVMNYFLPHAKKLALPQDFSET